MDKIQALLTTLHGIQHEKKLLKAREDAAKAELDAEFELGNVDKSVENKDLNVTATRSKTTTYQYSQECKDDIEKLKAMDIELGHAIKRETFSWTVRKNKAKPADD
ncbi:MAG: hypothetical protein VXX91_05290 [Planctomycetota bacterium]|nr:hypothetical protein [Planctomycetota bacterium]